VAVIVNTPDGPVAAGSTPVYTAYFVDTTGAAIPPTALASVTLTICDTQSGAIVNSVSQVNILNTGRGTVDSAGKLTITLEPGDTAMDEVPGLAQIQRSLVIDWATTSTPPVIGRHQVNFPVLALAGP